MDHCTKESEIDRIAEDLQKLKQIVTGNGKKGINTITERLAEDMIEVKADVKCLVAFQIQTETKADTEKRHKVEMHESDKIHKEELREIAKQNKVTLRWLIGLTITAILALLSQILI